MKPSEPRHCSEKSTCGRGRLACENGRRGWGVACMHACMRVCACCVCAVSVKGWNRLPFHLQLIVDGKAEVACWHCAQ